MGFKIWRKDTQCWSLAFDATFSTRDLVDERIAELNATWHDKIKFGELSFHAYPEEIKIAKNGDVIDKNLPIYKNRVNRRRKRKKGKVFNRVSHL